MNQKSVALFTREELMIEIINARIHHYTGELKKNDFCCAKKKILEEIINIKTTMEELLIES